MITLRRLLAHFRPRQRDSGIALLITLGVVALLLIIAMSFAFNSRADLQLAGSNASYMRADMLAQSGIQRVIGFLQSEMGDPTTDSYPRGKLYQTTGGNPWLGRRLIGSIENTSPHSRGVTVDNALAVRFNGNFFTPITNDGDANLDNNFGWRQVFTKTDLSREGLGSSGAAYEYGDSVVGRFVWLLLDETGKLDPGAVIDSSVTEVTKSGTARTGATVREMRLRAAFNSTSFADSWMHDSHLNGRLANGIGTWLSFEHMFSNPDTFSQAATDSVAQALFPYTQPAAEVYLQDYNANGHLDPANDSIVNRLALPAVGMSLNAIQLYDAFVGFPGNPTRNDSNLFSPWLKTIIEANPGMPNAQARSIAATQALMLVDQVDPQAADLTSVSGHQVEDLALVADATGSYAMTLIAPPADITGIQAGTGFYPVSLGAGAVPYESANYGLEEGFGLTELAVQITGTLSGTDLIITPSWKLELFNPLRLSDATAPSVTITYSLTIENANGNFVVNRSLSLTPDRSVDHDGGTMRYFETGWQPDAAHTEVGFMAPLADWRIANLVVTRVIVYYGSRVLQAWPRSISPVQVPYQRLIRWSEPAPIHPGSATAWNFVGMRDALFVPVDPGHANYNTFYALGTADGGTMLYADPTSTSIVTGAAPGAAAVTAAATAAGGTAVNISYLSNPYCQPDVPNNGGALLPFQRLGQIGRVHGAHTPNRSIMLWNRVDTNWPDEAPDCRILDMFFVTPNERGRLNINTTDDLVLAALLSGTYNIASAADMTMVRNAFRHMNNPPTWFRGDLGRMFAEATYVAAALCPVDTADAQAEGYITQIIELLDVRDQYYSAIVTAQALHDLAGFGGAPGAIQLGDTPVYGLVLAEQKMQAILHRDAFTKRVTLLSSSRLEE